MAAERAAIGVVGAGRWGKNLIRAFSGVDRSQVVSICDLDSGRLGDFALPPGARFCTEFADVVGDPAVDAVVIATPARIHAAQAIRALESGKHVFLEKPMALALRDAHRIRDAASRAGRRLMVGHLLRYHPAITELERLIDTGVLGAVRRVVALRLGPRARSNDEGPWWSLAPHDVSLARHLLRAEVQAVSAKCREFADGTSTINARLRLATGSAWLMASTAWPRKTRRLFVFGDRAAAVFDDGGPRPTLALLDDSSPLWSAPALLPSSDAESVLLSDGSELGAPIVLSGAEPLSCEAAHFVSAVLGRSKIATDADEGCAVTAALEAGMLSIARDGDWTRVPSLGDGRPHNAETPAS